MSSIHSLIRGLPGNKVTKLNHPGGAAITSKVTVVDSPPAARRRLVGSDPDQGVSTTKLRVVNNSLVAISTSEFRLVTPDGDFVIQSNGAIAAGAEAELDTPWVLRDDEYIEFKVLTTPTNLAVSPIDIFTTFADLRSSEVGRGRVQIKASDNATKVVVVPKPTPGRVHIPWAKNPTGPSYYAVKDIGVGTLPADVTTYLDDDGTVIQCGATLTGIAPGSPQAPAALNFGVRAMENQSLLASAALGGGAPTTGDAWAFPVYLIVPDPKVGQAGSSA